MKLIEKNQKILKWTARFLSFAIIAFGLPFYLGYGNPLPFIDADYTFWDNFWLSVFPLMFLALALGWKFPRISGYFLTIVLSIGLILGLIVHGEIIGPMLFPLSVGFLYLLSSNPSKSCKTDNKE